MKQVNALVHSNFAIAETFLTLENTSVMVYTVFTHIENVVSREYRERSEQKELFHLFIYSLIHLTIRRRS